MKNPKVAKLLVATAVLSAFAAVSSAQSVRHDVMDARAARADVARLRADMRNARRHHNWGKVRQDQRLINDDMKFIHKDWHKVRHAEGM